MDFIYSRLNNNLVDINRIESITLLKCEVEDEPIEGLEIGDYYLKVTVVDSDKVNYCDMSDLNADEQELLDKIYEEQQRAIGREDSIELASCSQLEIEQDEQTGVVTIKLLNIFGDVLDIKTLDLETEKIIRSITLDHQNKLLVFTLVDGSVINCDISELIDDYDTKILLLSNHVTEEVARLDGRITTETERAQAAEGVLTENLNQEIQDRQDAVTQEQTRAEGVEQSLRSDLEDEISRAQSEEVRIETKAENLVALEQQRAKAVEDILTEKLNQEITDRAADVDAEEQRATAKEGELEAAINSEKERAIGQEAILSQNIGAEIGDRINADIELSGKIADEKSRAQNAESTLTTNLNTEIAARQAAVTTLENNLNQEIQDRVTAVTNERTRAETVEQGLQDSIDTENQRALDAEEALRNKLTRYFDKFVGGENIDAQFTDAEKVYCYNGSVMEGGDVPSTTSIIFTQTSNKALYLKTLYVKYVTAQNEEVEYTYTFNSKVFDSNNQTKDLGGVSWLLKDSNNITYFAYNNNYGQQIGSGTVGIRECLLTTNDFAGCTVKEVRVNACGATSTNCKVAVEVAGDTWLYDEGGEGETSLYPLPYNDSSIAIPFTHGEGSTPGTGTLVVYENTFLTKEDGNLVKIAPEEEVVYINKGDSRIYLFDGTTLIEISKVLELGLTSTTAYRGDYGNTNRQNITNILSGETTFRGDKTFNDSITINQDEGSGNTIELYTDKFYGHPSIVIDANDSAYGSINFITQEAEYTKFRVFDTNFEVPSFEGLGAYTLYSEHLYADELKAESLKAATISSSYTTPIDINSPININKGFTVPEGNIVDFSEGNSKIYLAETHIDLRGSVNDFATVNGINVKIPIFFRGDSEDDIYVCDATGENWANINWPTSSGTLALTSDVTNEASAREQADNGLSTRISTLETLVDPGDEHTLAGLVYEELE